MWLININEKGCLLLVQSCALVEINCCCCCPSLLQHNVGREHCINNVVIPQSLLGPAMQRKVWLVVAWRDLEFHCRNQPSSSLLRAIQLVCLLPSSLQSTALVAVIFATISICLVDCCVVGYAVPLQLSLVSLQWLPFVFARSLVIRRTLAPSQ
jgi:hypothetical protein